MIEVDGIETESNGNEEKKNRLTDNNLCSPPCHLSVDCRRMPLAPSRSSESVLHNPAKKSLRLTLIHLKRFSFFSFPAQMRARALISPSIENFRFFWLWIFRFGFGLVSFKFILKSLRITDEKKHLFKKMYRNHSSRWCKRVRMKRRRLRCVRFHRSDG